MTMRGLIFALVCCVAPALVAAEPPERVAWDGSPIKVALPVGEERILRFPANHVRVGLPGHVDDQVRVFSNEGIVYLKAHDAFPAARALVEDVDTGAAYMLDLSASAGATDAELVVHRGRPDDAAREAPADAEEEVHQNLDYVALTRYAAQQLYGPRRLQPEARGIRQVSVSDDSVPMVRGAEVKAEPVAAWRGGEWYVTAVQLTNAVDRPVELDPRDLRGDWLTATFQHARLHPAGASADTTAVYLVSDRPFEESFWGVQ